MELQWLKISPSLQKGLEEINHLDSSKFEQFLKRIIAKIKVQNIEIFTDEEKRKLENIFKVDESNLMLIVKTVAYIVKRMLKFVFKPAKLKNDLCMLGLSEEKTDFFLKMWSLETKDAIHNLSKDPITDSSPLLSWSLNVELSSTHNKIQKLPKAHLVFDKGQQLTEIEMGHTEMYAMFLQFEAIQAELDSIIL